MMSHSYSLVVFFFFFFHEEGKEKEERGTKLMHQIPTVNVICIHIYTYLQRVGISKQRIKEVFDKVTQKNSVCFPESVLY